MPSLVTLPTELIVEIADNLRERPHDLKSFSSTNHRLRHVTSSILFRTLNIACPLVSHQLLEHMLNKYRTVISRIHLHVHLRPNLDEDMYDPVMPSVWGTARSDILVKLVRGEIFSHINSFSVHFDPCEFDRYYCWFGDGGDWGDLTGRGSVTIFEDIEGDDEVQGQETNYVWRAQYNQVFADLVMNPHITKLRFVDLIPKRTSVWGSEQWLLMMGRLTHFDLGIFGAELYDRHANMTGGFIQFIRNLPEYITQHLINVKHLRLEASVLSVFGTHIPGVGGDLFPLEDDMPNLHSLELKNIVLGVAFLEFIETQKILCELTLHNCMCRSLADGDELQWDEIWWAIAQNCKAMRRVTFLQDETPPLLAEYPRFREIVQGMLGEDPNLIVWRYVQICDDWGHVIEDENANVEAIYLGFAEGRYRDLMDMLADRRENLADEG